MEAALAELEQRQTGILERISKLECSLPPDAPTTTAVLSAISNFAANCDTEARLSNILRSNGVNNFSFKKVPLDYYDWSLESRRDVLGAASVHHLCKSIVLVNTQASPDVVDCSDRNYSKYYVVVVQKIFPQSAQGKFSHNQLELKRVNGKKGAKGKSTNDTVADLQKQMRSAIVDNTSDHYLT